MSRRAGCTIVAKSHLAYARVLARSFRHHHPGVPFFVLLADEAGGWFDPAAEPFTLVTLEQLALPHLERLRFHYDQQPFTYACTPALIAALHRLGFDEVVYFKQETLVLGSLAPLFDQLARHPVVVTPHLVAPLTGPDAGDREQNILQSGVYNVGVLGVAALPPGPALLQWWTDRLRRHCRHDVPGGMHFEQRWLDLAPAFFGVRVLRDPSYNIGHWSLPDRRVSLDADGAALVDGVPLRVFRFSGYRPDQAERITGYNQRLDGADLGAVHALVARVRQALDEEGYAVTRTWPYAFARFDNGEPVPALARHLYRELGDQVDGFGDPLRTAGAASYFAWLTGRGPDSHLTRLWDSVWASRPDLQQVFPDARGAGAPALRAWARAFGLAEYGLSAVWLDEEPA
jgi:hypothetical protein